MANQQLFELQTYTPNSDIAAGFQQSQIIWGRSGNDTLLGVQPTTASPGHLQIDTFVGDFAIDDPTFRQWSDTFILGDSTQSYYDNGNPLIFGVNDFAFITDFNPAQDFIQLHGTANDYQLVNVGLGEALFQQNEFGVDLIGFIGGNSGLSLESNYFQFKGYAPPEPVLPQIQQLGSSGFDLTPTTTTDPNGNVYVAGGTTGTLGEANNEESRDALVAKYDSLGNLLWTKQLGTSSADTIYGIATDNQGNFYVTGFTEGDLAAPKQAEVSDTWLAKYDSDGNELWIQQFGEASISQGFSIDVDDDSNVYLSGITVKPAPEIATDDLWVTKYDTNGNRQWFTEVGSSAFDESYAVTVSNDGSVYAAGWSLGDFAQENAGAYDGVLAKLDNDGQVEWTKQFGTADYEWTWGVDTDSQGNVYATGWTLGSLGGENAGSYDVFLTKYDPQGNQVWIQQFGTAGDDEAFRINIDSNDNIFLTGYTDNSLGGTNAGSYDAWVAKYDTDGNQGWITQFGTPELDHGLGITSDKAGGNIYVTGVTGGSLGATNAGSFDSWVAKIDSASGILENFSGTSKSLDASPALNFVVNDTEDSVVTNSEVSDTEDSVLTNSEVSDTEDSVLTNSEVSDTGDCVLTNSEVSDTGDSVLTNSEVSDTGDSVLTNSEVSDTDDCLCTNEQIVDFVGSFVQDFIEDNNLQIFAETASDFLDSGMANDLLSAIYSHDSIDSSDNTIYGTCDDDLFVLNPDEGASTIMNFEMGKDLLGLTEGLTFEQLSITQGSSCDEFFTEISIADSNTLLATLSGVHADTMTSCSFTLV
ncbi:MAG: SBBP repeat-containing protein [Cyanobacteriota bacterium]